MVCLVVIMCINVCVSLCVRVLCVSLRAHVSVRVCGLGGVRAGAWVWACVREHEIPLDRSQAYYGTENVKRFHKISSFLGLVACLGNCAFI